MNHLKTPAPASKDSVLANWIQDFRTKHSLNVKAISFNECKEWSFLNGTFAHKTGRFFKIIGCKATGNVSHLNGLEQPMIDQPEIGILGFVTRKTDHGWEWLVQAKAEPGNVGGFQAAPSVQATRSNYEIVHKGQPTPLIECFTGSIPDEVSLLTDIHQSEQGDRFINKFNRNCVAIVPQDYPVPENGLCQWFSVSDIRCGLLADFIINNDARSVFFCSDWQMLCDRGTTPFTKWTNTDGFGYELFQSFTTDTPYLGIDDLHEKFNSAQESTVIDLDYIPLDELKGWDLGDETLKATHKKASFFVRSYSMHIKSREVDRWCQPLVESTTQSKMALLSTRIDGILHFFLRFSAEPGFKDNIQLGPSYVDDPNHYSIPWCKKAIEDEQTIKQIEVKQSDEGGRFMNSVVEYQIYIIDPKWIQKSTDNGVWLTLSQLHDLAKVKGYLTNETRSILSMLLAWL